MHRARLAAALALVMLAVTQIGLYAQTPAPAKSPNAAVVNLNAASVEQLDALPGIGKAMATRIVEYRQKNGPFKKVEDLMNIRGIGEKNFLKLKPLITVGAPRTAASAPER